MKAILKTEDLKRLIKATAKFISKDDNRQILQWIQLKFDKEKLTVTAAALDGYKLSVETVLAFDIDESFTAYIRPYLPVGAKDIYSKIELADDRCLIDIGGRFTGYKQPKDDFYNVEKFLQETEQLLVVKEVALTRDFLVDALKSLQQDEFKRLPVIIQLRDNLKPVSVKMGKSTRYILPVRR
jgi:DNA polymerase III sliding clamp (beta) subunit (PCNA family)